METIKSFVATGANDLIEVKEVGDKGLLIHIALTINGEEVHHHSISFDDDQRMISKKRNELLLLAEFTSLDKPDHIWNEIVSGSFDRCLENYQRQNLYH